MDWIVDCELNLFVPVSPDLWLIRRVDWFNTCMYQYVTLVLRVFVTQLELSMRLTSIHNGLQYGKGL